MKRVIFLCCLSFIGIVQGSFSQKSYFKHFSIQDGLPQSSVFTMMQDSRGYLWLGTLGGGVARFNGSSFETFNTSNGLAGNIVRAVFEDDRGNLWFGTDQGITIYDGYAFNHIDTASGLLGLQVLSFCQAADGSIWSGTDGGLNRLRWMGNDSVMVLQYGHQQGLPYRLVFDIYESPDGALWLATYQDGVIIIGFTGDGHISKVERLNNDQIPAGNIIEIEPDGRGTLWFGTAGSGAFNIRFDPSSGTYTVKTFNKNNGLRDLTVWNILAASDGTVWLGTGEGGIHAFKDDQLRYYGTPEGTPSDQVLSLLEDTNGQIWAGTNDNGFFRFMGNHFCHFDTESGLPHNAVSGIVQDRHGSFWLSSYGGGLSRMSFRTGSPFITRYGEPDGLPDLKINGLSLAPDGTLWLATSDHGIVRYDGKRFANLTNLNGLVDNHVNAVLADSKGNIWCGTNTGICKYNGTGFFCIQEDDEFRLPNNLVYCVIEDHSGHIWAGTWDGLVEFTEHSMTSYDEEEGLDFRRIHTLAEDPSGNIWIGTFGGGIYMLNTHTTERRRIRLVADDPLIGSNNIASLLFTDRNTLIVATDKGFDRLTLDDSLRVISVRNYDRTDGFIGQENNVNALCLDTSGRIWFGTVKGLTCYDRNLENLNLTLPSPFLTGIRLSYEEVNWKERADSVSPWTGIPVNLKLSYTENHVTFDFMAISMGNPDKLRYRYRLLERDTIWSPPRKETQVTYSGLAPGTYVFEVSACNEAGLWNPVPMRYAFIIKPPFYRTWWFIFLAILAAMFFIFSYIKLRERNLIREKRELEAKVNERTMEIMKQKAVIEEKNIILETANRQITFQKEMIEMKNRDITASIHYAKRIQDAILPSQKMLQETLADSFILFKPKDIVSGDFYWTRRENKRMIVVAADCTGHGVPGALMSMLGISFLDEIVDKEGFLEPGRILNKLRDNIVVALKQKGEQSETKDGMDISICCLDMEKNTLSFAGANNPLYMIRKNVLTEIKADRMPVAIHATMDSFASHTIRYELGDQFYLTSDGYADQFGGPDGKKIKYKPFKNLLLSACIQPMEAQKRILDDYFENWKKGPGPDGKSYEQVDDVVIVGFRVI